MQVVKNLIPQERIKDKRVRAQLYLHIFSAVRERVRDPRLSLAPNFLSFLRYSLDISLLAKNFFSI
jgi:hypothetical protein